MKVCVLRGRGAEQSVVDRAVAAMRARQVDVVEIERHEPQLAHTRSEFERRLIRLCEGHGLPIPTFNVWLHGFLADAVWRDNVPGFDQ